MPSRSKEDVLVHYDEESGELVFFTIPAAKSEVLRKAAFGGVRPTVEELRAMHPSEAMQRVGGTVVALLELSSKRKLGIAEHPANSRSGNNEL